NVGGIPGIKTKYNSPFASNGDTPIPPKIAFEPVEPKARQLELFRPRRNVQPRQHSGRLRDQLPAHATTIVFVVEDFQPAMLKAMDHRRFNIVSIVTCQSVMILEAAVFLRRGRGAAGRLIAVLTPRLAADARRPPEAERGGAK